MFSQILKPLAGAAIACLTLLSSGSLSNAESDGVVRVRSAYPFAEAITRIKQDISTKGIMFFSAIDQSKLAAEAGVDLKPSTLLIVGNPPLGTQFMSSNPVSGLDWPVRLLVFEDATKQVWVAYTDFDWIAKRHEIRDREAQFKMASEVIASIVSSVEAEEGL
jgi:uncharacterized protein (DUF302 family)